MNLNTKNCTVRSIILCPIHTAIFAVKHMHNTSRRATVPGERTTARTAVFTGMCIDLPCPKKKRKVTWAGFELATLRLGNVRRHFDGVFSWRNQLNHTRCTSKDNPPLNSCCHFCSKTCARPLKPLHIELWTSFLRNLSGSVLNGIHFVLCDQRTHMGSPETNVKSSQ